MRVIRQQKGFTLTPALLILVLLMIAGTTYLIYINSIGKTSIKIEKAQVAKFAAETGINQIKSKLALLNASSGSDPDFINKWYNAKSSDDTSWLFHSDASLPEDRNETNTDRESVRVKLSSTDNAEYKITIEDGSFVSGSKTSTGSSIKGVDKYGNKIWSNDQDKNYFRDRKVYRFGVKSDGFSKGDNSSQSIYAVIDVPANSNSTLYQTWSAGFPSQYLISTNGYEAPSGSIPSRYLTLLSGQIITGKVHSNNRMDFLWRGDFDVAIDPNRDSWNDNFTVYHGRWSTSTDASPILVKDIVKEEGQLANQFTIYGTNFSLDKTKMSISVNGSPNAIPDSVIEGKQIIPPNTVPTGVEFGTKMTFTIPNDKLSDNIYNITITSAERSQSLTYRVAKELIKTVPVSISVPPLRIYGIMQVNTNVNKMFTQDLDYSFIGPPTYSTNAPYINWISSNKPADGSYYYITYITEKNIPHNLIKVYDNLTYSGGANPNMFYIHDHRAPGTKPLVPLTHPFADTHEHSTIFGMNSINLLTAIAPTDYINPLTYIPNPYYDWSTPHQHKINQNLLNINHSKNDDIFFKWGSGELNVRSDFKPKSSDAKISPILAPNNVNFKTQREYANQILKAILNKEIQRESDGTLKSLDTITEDRANGYYDMKGGMLDLRSTYFGNDLKYYDGEDVLSQDSKITDTAIIYVNDNKDSVDYMSVAKTKRTSDYHQYIYRQIPKNVQTLSNDSKNTFTSGIMFVREGVVRIGGAEFQGNVTNTNYVHTGSTVSSPPQVLIKDKIYGNNTIIDGRLTIISYSESKPAVYINNDLTTTLDNKGDIVITGNIIYKNKIVPWENQVTKKDYDYTGFKQYSLSNKQLTEEDGKVVNNFPLGEKVNALGLVASNDIKIPVAHYRHPSNLENHYTTDIEEQSSDCPCKDTLVIHGQLIAGNKVTQTKVDFGVTSKNDRLIIYGSVYSFLPPDFSYFDRGYTNNREEDGMGRIYLYDKTISEVQISGMPSFPKTDQYQTSDYAISSTNLPVIVPGTWKVVSDGAQ